MKSLLLAKIYGIEHITYLVIVFIVFAGLIIFAKKHIKTDKQQRKLVLILGLIGLAFIIFNRTTLSMDSANFFNTFYPRSVCGIHSFALSLSMIFCKKDSKIFHYLCYMCMISAPLTIFYPEFLPQAESIWYGKTISGLLHHTTLFINSIMMIVIGYVKPDIKKINHFYLGGCVLVTLGIFNMDILGYSSSVQINKPLLPNTIFTWFVVGMCIYLLVTIFLVTYDYFDKKEESFIKKLFKKQENK